MQIEMSAAGADDIDELMVIDAESFMAPWHRKELFMYAVASGFSLAVLRCGPRRKIAGFVGMQTRDRYIAIDKLCVAPEYRRRHVATHVLDTLNDRLKFENSSNRTHIRTVARATDEIAKNLFWKCRFKTLCFYPNYWQNPDGSREDGILLRFSVNEASNNVGITPTHDQTNRISNLYK